MSGVMGASLRSMTGSPACTARVSEWGIGSAYRKSLEPEDLLRVADPLQHSQARRQLLLVARDQGSLAADPSRVGPRARTIEQRDRSLEPAQIVARPAEGSLSLSLDERELSPSARIDPATSAKRMVTTRRSSAMDQRFRKRTRRRRRNRSALPFPTTLTLPSFSRTASPTSLSLSKPCSRTAISTSSGLSPSFSRFGFTKLPSWTTTVGGGSMR